MRTGKLYVVTGDDGVTILNNEIINNDVAEILHPHLEGTQTWIQLRAEKAG